MQINYVSLKQKIQPNILFIGKTKLFLHGMLNLIGKYLILFFVSSLDNIK